MTDKDTNFETWVAPETHEQKMERLRLAEEHETKRSKNKLREARQETWQIVWIGFCVTAVIIAIVAAIYFGTSGPDSGPSNREIEQERELACMDHGGGWVPEGLLDDPEDTDAGICVYPGKVVSE